MTPDRKYGTDDITCKMTPDIKLSDPSDLLEKLPEFSKDELKNNIDAILRTLLSSLASGNEGQKFQAVQALLTFCLPVIPLSDVEQQLFQHAVPAVVQLFTDAVEAIKSSLDEQNPSPSDDIECQLTTFLQVCLDMLRCAETVLEYVASQGRVQVEKVYSVPKNFSRMLVDAFQHCRESENLYGDYVAVVLDHLKSVSLQIHQVQVHFFNVLTDNVVFNCYMENELILLIEVLEALSEAGELLFCMDVKVMAEQWKGYTRLTQLYEEPLKQRLDVSKPLAILTSEVVRPLKEIAKLPASDSKSAAKMLKVGSFLLRIITKLCEQFGGGYLGEAGASLFQLLLTLYSCSPACTADTIPNPALVGDIDRYIVVAAEALLGILFSDHSFRNEFFRWCDEECDFRSEIDSSVRVPVVLFIIALMKQLLQCDAEKRSMWLPNDTRSNLFFVLFSIVKSGHEDFMKDITIPVVISKGSIPQNLDLYGALIAHAGALIVSAQAKEIEPIEWALLQNTLQPNPWAALLASDLWCILARIATSDMCLRQILHLVDILNSMIEGNVYNRPEKTYLITLLRRLVPLLNAQGKATVVQKISSTSSSLLWHAIGLAGFPENEFKSKLAQNIVAKAEESLASYNKDELSPQKFRKMIEGLHSVCTAFENVANLISSNTANLTRQGSLVEGVSVLWQRIPEDNCRVIPWLTTGEVHNSISFWLENLICALCYATEHLITVMNNQQILHVLSRLKAILPTTSSTVKLHALKVLKGLARKRLDNDLNQTTICSDIASIFATLLLDSNPLVRSFSLDTFDYFAHVTQYENIVVITVGKNIEVERIFTNHLQKKTPVCAGNVVNVQDYFRAQSLANLVHTCVWRKETVVGSESEIVEQPSKKIKLDNDLNFDDFDFQQGSDQNEELLETVRRLKDACAAIVAYSAVNSVPSSCLDDLKTSISDLQNVVILNQ